jgi:hypothetical protein
MLFTNGYGTIIASAVTRDSNNNPTVTGQVRFGATNYPSRVGNLNATGSAVTLPNSQVPQSNQTLYVTEVFYPFAPATPVGNLLNLLRGRATNAPTASLLYDVTFF